MNTREKAAFLRAEKWWSSQNLWTATNHPFYTLDEAYAIATRIASRRKAQRERAALKKAGLVYGEAEPPRCGIGWWNPEGMYWYGDRAEALKQLGIP